MVRVQGEPDLRDVISALTRLLEGKTQAEEDMLAAAAAKALSTIGPAARPAIPALVKALRKRPGRNRGPVAEALGQIGYGNKRAIRALRRILRQNDRITNDRYLSVSFTAPFDALGKMGPEATAVLVDVLRTASDREALEAAASALVENNPSSIPMLVRALEDETSSVTTRIAVLHALGELGDSGVEDYPGVRYPTAAWARGEIGSGARKEAVPALACALKDSDSSVRWTAACALRGIGVEAKEAAPALMQTLSDANRAVGDAVAVARVATGDLGNDAEAVVRVLARALRSDDNWTRLAALEAMGEIGVVPIQAVRPLFVALGKSLERGSHLIRHNSLARALATAKPDIIPVVIHTLDDKNSGASVRGAAAWVLGRIRPMSAEVLVALVRTLEDEDRDVRSSAAYALAAIGPEAGEAVPALTRALGRVPAATDALARIGVKAVPHLLGALKDGAAVVRCEAAEALREIRPVPAEVLAALVRALEDEDGNVRSSAAYTLGAIRPGGSEVVTALARALEDTDWKVRVSAVDALAKLGSEAKEALPGLVRALEDTKPHVQSGAAETLGKMGPEAEEALPALARALVAGPGREAAYALAAIGGVRSVPILIDSLRTLSPIGEPRSGVVASLSEVASQSSEVRLILIRAAEDQCSGVRSGAIAALGGLKQRGREDGECSAVVRRAVDDEDASVRMAAVTSLGRGREETESVSALVRTLDDKDWPVALAAARALDILLREWPAPRKPVQVDS